MAAHKYWRYWLGSQFGGNYNYESIDQVDMLDANGNSLCVGGTPIQSTQYSSYNCARAFPGGSGGWCSNNELPCWIGYEFLEPVAPAKFVHAGSGIGNRAYLIHVQYSDDGNAWTDAYFIAMPPGGWPVGQRYVMPVPDVSQYRAPYWAMLSDANGRGDGNSGVIAEMRFLDAQGEPIPGFTAMRGAWVGSEDWSPAWDGDPTTQVVLQPPCYSSVYGLAQYPGPVQVIGLSLQSQDQIAGWTLVPFSGRVLASLDGLLFVPVWAFGDDNAVSGFPRVQGGVTTYVTAPPPPPPPVVSPIRRLGPMIA